MAHELEIVNGSASFVDAGRVAPWHRLGVLLNQDGMDLDTMLKLSNLDFVPYLVPVEAPLPNGKRIVVSGKQVVVADRPWGTEALGVVGRRWAPVTPRIGATFAQDIIHASDGYAGWQTAGMLRPENKYDDTIGSQCFYTLKLDGTHQVGGVDPMEMYLLITHGFDGTLAFTLALTGIRVVCANTQNAALRGAQARWKMHHGKRIEGRIQEAREALTLTLKGVDAFQAEADQMIDQAMTDAEFNKLVAHVFPAPAKDASDRVKDNYVDLTDKLLWHFNDSPTIQNVKGTKWAAYNAVTEYLDWGQTIRGGNDDVKRAARTLNGEYRDQKEAAWTFLGKRQKVVALVK
jgi:phage/plasmid-like protein (TIGR03299 family)